MDNIITRLVLILAFALGLIEMRSIDRKNSFLEPTNWKKENGYTFTWKGSFTYGVPPESNCPKVFQPENGRFICSHGTLLKRNMCLVECKIGFEQVIPPVVYLCIGGEWNNLRHQKIQTPQPQCVLKTEDLKLHFPQ